MSKKLDDGITNLKIYGRKVKDRFSRLNLQQRAVALAMAGTFIVSGIATAYFKRESDTKRTTFSLVDLKDEKQNDVHLYDENNNEIQIRFSDMSQVNALVNENHKNNNDQYEVTLIDSNGKMQVGYIDEEYLSDNNIQRLNISKAPFNDAKDSTDSFNEIFLVSAKSGAWLRPNTIVDRNSDEPIYLDSGTYVLSSNSSIISSGNDYSWRKCIVYYNEQLRMGYIASEYLMNADFNKASGKHFKVNSKIGLKLRSKADTQSNIITTLEDGEEVILVPNIETNSTDKYDWFYLATKKNNEIVLGYSAATMYKNDGTIVEYLVPVENNKVEENPVVTADKHIVIKQVNTRKSGITLKLREKPTTNSSIIARIQNGTLINTTEEDYETALKSQVIDGHKWLKIQLVTGEKGYVAVDYLENYVQQDKKYNLINANFEGKDYKGYFGIDISCNPNVYSPGKLGEILDNNHKYPTDDQFARGTVVKKPDYVMFRIGATGHGQGNFSIATHREDYYDHVLKLALECEKRAIPYGFYYYSQAVNKEEARKEIDYIVGFFKNAGKLKYNILPFGFDEEIGTYVSKKDGKTYDFRNLHYVKKNGKEALTSNVNYEMNELRQELKGYDIDSVILYIPNGALDAVVDYSKLDSINQKDVWLVDVNKTHERLLKNNHANVLPNVIMRQTEIDRYIYDNSGKKVARVDCDFINQNYFENRLTSKLGKDVLKSSNQKSGGQVHSNNNTNKIFGIYPGSIKNIDAINNLDAFELFSCIKNMSDKISIGMNDESISTEELLEDQYALEYMMYQTRKFGVNLSEPSIGKHIEATQSFNNWYNYYLNYLNNLNDNELNENKKF